MTALEHIIKKLARLPGIGKKSATRMAFYLLSADQDFLESLGEEIKTLKIRIKPCSSCGHYTEADPCDICSDANRDEKTICVVESSQDVMNIESTHEYQGYFHVLHGLLSPLDGIGPKELNMESLINRVKEGNIKEVIIATNPTVEGDTTALYLVKLIQPFNIKISRIATGVPVGGDVEYADKLTLTRSLKGRIDY